MFFKCTLIFLCRILEMRLSTVALKFQHSEDELQYKYTKRSSVTLLLILLVLNHYVRSISTY